MTVIRNITLQHIFFSFLSFSLSVLERRGGGGGVDSVFCPYFVFVSERGRELCNNES